MAPKTRLEIVEAAVASIPSKNPSGPFQPNAFIQWHQGHFGPHDKFGYKDFNPLFTAE